MQVFPADSGSTPVKRVAVCMQDAKVAALQQRLQEVLIQLQHCTEENEALRVRALVPQQNLSLVWECVCVCGYAPCCHALWIPGLQAHSESVTAGAPGFVTG